MADQREDIGTLNPPSQEPQPDPVVEAKKQERGNSSAFEVSSSMVPLKKGSSYADITKEEDNEDEYSLSIDQILALKEQFDAADTDGGGSLDIDEVERLFMQIDANSDGQVDWGEFSEYMLLESQANQTESAIDVSAFLLPEKSGDCSEVNWHVTTSTCATVDNHGGFYITAAKDHSIRLWFHSSMLLAKTIYCPDWVHAMCVLPGIAKLCVASADRRIRLYDINSWDCAREIELSDPAVCLCTWKSKEDDEMLAYGDAKGQITVVNVSRGFEKSKSAVSDPEQTRYVTWVDSTTKTVHDGWVNQIRMIDDLGCLVSCGSDSAIIFFEYPMRTYPHQRDRVMPKRVLRSKAGHTKGVKCFTWIKSQKVIASGGLERAIVMWNPYTGKPISSLIGHQIGIHSLEFIAEFDKMISLAMDHVVKIWDIVLSECIQTMTAFDTHSKTTAALYDPNRHRLVMCSRKPICWKIHPRILIPRSETTHISPIVAILYNRLHGQLVTVAEDSETVIWRISNGRRIFSFFNTEKEDDCPLSCATYDEAGRRLMTGDHQGKVLIWNFNNGGCLKVLEKPKDRNKRQEITDVVCYSIEQSDARFVAASSWDRRITIWVDDSEDSTEPLMRIQAHTADVVSLLFAKPKSLISSALDGSIHVFDIESGVKRGSLSNPAMFASNGLSMGLQNLPTDMLNTPYIEKIRTLPEKGNMLVGVGSDGYIFFWDENSFGLLLHMYAKHFNRTSLVDVQADAWNRILVTGDSAGYVKVWSIDELDWTAPKESQVKPMSFWQAHQKPVSSLDIVPYQRKGESRADFLAGNRDAACVLVTGSQDKRAIVWSFSGIMIGQLGQESEWDLEEVSTWSAQKSLSILETEKTSEALTDHAESAQESEEEDVDVLALLDERLRPKSQIPTGSPAVPIAEIPENLKKNRRKDYAVDPYSGERIYKNMERKNLLAEERKRMMTPYLRAFAKKVDPDNTA